MTGDRQPVDRILIWKGVAFVHGPTHTLTCHLPMVLHRQLAKNYQTSSTVPASGMIGIGTLSPGDKSVVWLAGEEADLSTAVDTQRMYLVSASGLLAWSGLSSGLAMNRFNTS